MEHKGCQEDLFCGINMAEGDEMPDLAKKHTPVIAAPATVGSGELFEVTIEVGKLLKHPNENGHFIQWLELYSGHTFITRVDFTAKMGDPRVTIPVKLEHVHDLKAVARCNLHGAWVGTHRFQ